MTDIDTQIRKAAEILAKASNVAASCGAGISAESGIATFRDAGGVWEKLNPAEVGTAEGLMESLMIRPEKLIPFVLELLDAFEAAEPNAAHLALGELERMGLLKTVITQNIDNLHHEAGNTDVIEVHGNGFRLSCISCGGLQVHERKRLIRETREKITTLADFSISGIAGLMPACSVCRSFMRPDVVMFGETVKDIPRAFAAARNCDVMLAIGTSGVVYPAAYLPFDAKEAGARVIVINPNENPFASVSDAYIPMNAGEAMPKLITAIKEIRKAG